MSHIISFRLTLLALTLGSLILPVSAAGDLPNSSRPNILWITSEDNGRFLGCYGDPQANTPNLDSLAERGIRYTRFYANAPVCAVARSGWITGVPAVTQGTQHMRSRYRIPDSIVPYPTLLKQAGYYVTNNSKTDYNTRSFEKEIWDACGKNAHYKNAPQGKPFCAVFNITTSHESRIFPDRWRNKPGGGFREPQTPATGLPIPPYQVQTPEVITDWRRMYDCNTAMDAEVGKLLQELEASGKADNTIVIYCSDHGGITLRSKRFLYDSGSRVPLIVAFPKSLQHLAPQKPGTVSERLTQFMDLPPTLLSLVGITPPQHMTGKVFLGSDIQAAPETVYLFSNRFDEAPEMRRGVTDGRWKYIRNYQPDRPRFQMLEFPLNQAGQQSQWREYQAGRTNDLQTAFYQEQPPEELYDLQADPHEVHNLAHASEHAAILKRFRDALQNHIFEYRDAGFIPEPMLAQIDEGNAAANSIYEFAQSSELYPLDKISQVADLASSRNPANVDRLTEFTADNNPIVRYWAMVGLRALGDQAKPATETIKHALADDSASVRVNAAIALGNLGQMDMATEALVGEAKAAKSDIAAAWALDGLKYLDAPSAIDGISEQELNQGKYSGRTYALLKAGGSMHRMPEKKPPLK